jgi:cytochrome b561
MTEGRPRGYSGLQVLLHWTIAGLVFFQLLVNDGMRHAFVDLMDGKPVEDGVWALLHIGFGMAILALAVLRLTIRLVRGAPLPHDDKPPIINWFGYAVHVGLYGMILLMPLAGAIAWFGRSDLAAEAHGFGKVALIVLIVLHVLGAFVEHFVFRNDTLMRMLRAERRAGETGVPDRTHEVIDRPQARKPAATDQPSQSGNVATEVS